MEKQNYWVGRFKGSDKMVLFDPELNGLDTAEVTLFLPGEMALRTYKIKEVRPRLEKVKEEAFQLVAQSSYERWQRQQRRKHEQQSLSPKQAKILARLRRKMAYWQKKRQNRDQLYVTGTECYCGKGLHPLYHQQCKRCGWLICSDHHCGCTYRWERGQ